MPQVVNTSSLQSQATALAADDTRETAIAVNDVSMVFNMASEQLNSLKEYAIALAKGELRFKGFTALDSISFEVKKGDVFGIMGTNGSGKSTLLKIVAGVLEPSKGGVTVNGNIAPLIELGAGFDYELTARENVYLNGALLGYSKEFIDQHFDKIVEFAEVEQFLDMPLKNYSSGMVSRIAFAIATVIVPEILIVDEVLSVGDFMFQQKCERRIQELIKEYGVTVLIVSHSTEQIERLCNKAVWIEKSHLRMVGTAHDVCSLYRYIGGREGSAEAEQRIIDVVLADAPLHVIEPPSITSDSKYGVAVKINEMVYEKNSTAILVRYDSIHEGFMANGLSGILDAPIYYYENGAIPDATFNSLIRLGVTKAVVFGPEEQTRLVAKRLETLEGFTSCQEFNADNNPDLCAKLYQAYKDQWGDTAFITREGRAFDLGPLAPSMVKLRAPLFYIYGRELEPAGCVNMPPMLLDEIPERFAHVISLGEIDGLDDGVADAWRAKGVDVTVISEDGWIERAAALDRWVEDNHTEVFTEAVVIPLFKTENIAPAATYAAKRNAVIVPESPNHLESIANTLDIVQRYASTIQEITFVGGAEYFNGDTKALIAKATALGK